MDRLWNVLSIPQPANLQPDTGQQTIPRCTLHCDAKHGLVTLHQLENDGSLVVDELADVLVQKKDFLIDLLMEKIVKLQKYEISATEKMETNLASIVIQYVVNLRRL
ncbi:hypothetical protein KIN20_008127 [Parelaphostrongylus tenuis]|uniref:Uncharacterized protein n=1 Tax=Parelaphostrongylus tenuis TaxID=148309 RepID=A0AAD5M950_PARTN|nr:hypothetical protein KIN20_008127 [Parelaphostrongylus tenuis]